MNAMIISSMRNEMNSDLLSQINDYHHNCRLILRAHYMRANELEKRNFYMGIPVLVTTTLIGTSIFASISTDPSIGYKIACGLLSISAALLSGLQTLLDLSGRSQRHRLAGARYAAMRRDLEIFRLMYLGSEQSSRTEALKALTDIVDRLAKLAEDSPVIQERHWQRAYKEVHELPPSSDVPKRAIARTGTDNGDPNKPTTNLNEAAIEARSE